MSSVAPRPVGTPGLHRLFEAVSEVLTAGGRPGGPDGLPEALCPVLAAALDDPRLLPEHVASDQPSGGFGKHLLHTGPEFTLFATITAPGNALPVHDHGSWGVVGVHRGVEEEIRYGPSSAAAAGAPELVEVDRVLHRAGAVTAVRPPPADIHAVANAGTDWSICVHLFAADPLAQGFNLYLPPAFAPQPTGPLVYDTSPGGR